MDPAFLQSCHLVVNRVSKRFVANGESLWAVRDLTLCARPGEFAAVVGPNGGGQVHLLAMLAGFEPVTEGSITLAAGRSPVLARIAAWRFRRTRSFL